MDCTWNKFILMHAATLCLNNKPPQPLCHPEDLHTLSLIEPAVQQAPPALQLFTDSKLGAAAHVNIR
jgi:hypothetical protein